MTAAGSSGQSRYARMVERVFLAKHASGDETVDFTRDDLVEAAKALGIDLPKNVGDVVYSVRYRTSLPDTITATAPDGKHWVINGAGIAQYRFELVDEAFIEPTPDLAVTKIPDATPGIIDLYSLSDEQALLAKLRYNRLIDIFLGITCYSLQNHLRTTVPDLGQVETDEIYVGIDKRGAHYVVPVQAKGGTDKQNTVQIKQDFDICSHKFPRQIAIPIAAQFMADDLIALLAFELQDGQPKRSAERHYRLVPPADLSDSEIAQYAIRADQD